MRALLAAVSLIATLATPALAQRYEIQPGDRLSVSVLEDPLLDRQVLVRPDGYISMPIGGSIKASGRSVESVEEIIRSRLSGSFAIRPTISVALIQEAPMEEELMMDTIKIYVMGEVSSPGLKEVETPVTFLQAISLAGGLSDFAATQRIQLRRQKEGAQKTYLMDYNAVEQGAEFRQIVEMRDGDVIIVPQRRLFEF
ncbi:polysaccharide biosynthesis/export family protein [Paracoccaceae bacterium GXU_MW_L88]